MDKHTARTILAIPAAIAAILAAATASAQEAQPAAATPELGEVIVTAQKRAQDIRTVPTSVSVVSQDQLENLHVTQLADVASYVPGLQVVSGGSPGQVMIALRGIAPISAGANTGTYVDETPLGSSSIWQRETTFQLDLLPYDIERIEVLRGPQGTLYGAGSMGGLLKYVTVSPDLTNYGFQVGGGFSDTAGAGNTGSILRIGANLPLVEGRFAIRASYALNYIPGYVDNMTNGDRDLNEGEQESARLAMLWQIADGVDFELTGMKQSIDSDNNAHIALDPATLRPIGSEFGNILSVNEPFGKDIDYLAATLNWDLGFATFVSATGYSEATTDQRVDATQYAGLLGLPPGFAIAWFDLGLDFRKITQEFRLTSAGAGPLAWQLGAYYSEEDAHNSQVIRLASADGSPFPIPGYDPLADLTVPSDYTETAFFANGSYALTDRFTLGAGVRYASNEQEYWQNVTGGVLIPLGMTRGASDEDVFTWMLDGKFQVTDDAMLYARIATGYQPGGPNAALPGVPPSVDSSTLTSYEIGLKSDFADNRVLLDVAAFHIDWEDIQIGVVDTDSATSWLINGGKAASQGVELTTRFKATERFLLGLDVTYTDAEVTEDIPALGGVDGDTLPYIPKLAWSAVADYRFPIGSAWNGRVGLAYRWVDDRKTNLDSNPGAFPLDSYGALDLSADVGNEHWTLSAYARNATDERAYTNIATSFSGETPHLRATPIQPRTYGLEIDYRF